MKLFTRLKLAWELLTAPTATPAVVGPAYLVPEAVTAEAVGLCKDALYHAETAIEGLQRQRAEHLAAISALNTQVADHDTHINNLKATTRSVSSLVANLESKGQELPTPIPV